MTFLWFFAALFVVVSGVHFGPGHIIWRGAFIAIFPGLVVSLFYPKEERGSVVMKWMITSGVAAALFEYAARGKTSEKKEFASSKSELWMKGVEAFEMGKKKQQAESYSEALEFFDTAIQAGFADADVFSLRATCLQNLGWHLDAIDDYTKAIEMSAIDCNLYFQRSVSKNAVGDSVGSNADLNNAVELSKSNSRINQAYNKQAREWGYSCLTSFYESQRAFGTIPEIVRAKRVANAELKGRRQPRPTF